MKKYSSFFFSLMLILTLTIGNTYARVQKDKITETFPEIETSKLSW